MNDLNMISLRCDTCGGTLNKLEGNVFQCSGCLGQKYIENYSDKEYELLKLADLDRQERMLFERAIEGYEAVLKINPNNVSALWGMFLSEFGIEYIQDIDGTFKPTFHRLSKESVQDNRYYKKAINLLPAEKRNAYIIKANEIEKIRKITLDKANKNKPYDIFICYKKTASNGELTPEASWAQDYYNEFTAMGYKVFFADKSIEAGSEYEPSVFNALYTARFMLILCTNVEYLESKWVINEWGRFVRRKKNEPNINFCLVYENINPYDVSRHLRETQFISHSKAACFEELKTAISKVFKGVEVLKHQVNFAIKELTGGEIAPLAAEVKVEQIERVKLGSYQIGQVSVSDQMRLAEVRENLALSSFKYALEILDKELLSSNPNNYEALFLKLLAQTNSQNEEKFWSYGLNLSNKATIESLLNCAPKAYSESFINQAIKLCVQEQKESAQSHALKVYHNNLEFFAKYDVPLRQELIDSALELAVSSCDEQLIESVERCLDKKQDRRKYVDFYYSIARKYEDQFINAAKSAGAKEKKNNAIKYYNKAIAIDAGHTASLFSVFLFKYHNKKIFDSTAEEEFQNICRYSNIEQREVYLDEIIDILFEFVDNKYAKFDAAVWNYVALYNKDGEKIRLALRKVFKYLQNSAKYQLAEKYCAAAIALDEKNEELYLSLLQIKLKCQNNSDLTFVKSLKIRDTNEYRMAQQCAAEKNNSEFLKTIADISRRQFDNIENNAKKLKPKKLKPSSVFLIKGASIAGLKTEEKEYLTNMVIPSSIREIKDYAFRGNASIISVDFEKNSRLISIGDSAFLGCYKLASIKIPSSVTSIGEHAFYGCIGLTSITFESSSQLTSIGSSTFSSCSSLASIEIPSSVSSIGYGAFDGCSNLASIMIPSSVSSIDGSTFSNCSSLTSIEIPSSVSSIGPFAFRDCYNLASIKIPSSVTNIASYTFSGCSNLASIKIPSSVTSIDRQAFYGCSNLASIKIPSSVSSIGEWAFHGCSSLTSIEIPSSVTSIGEWAFLGCSSLTIYVEASKKPKDWHVKWNPHNCPVVWGHTGNNAKPMDK